MRQERVWLKPMHCIDHDLCTLFRRRAAAPHSAAIRVARGGVAVVACVWLLVGHASSAVGSPPRAEVDSLGQLRISPPTADDYESESALMRSFAERAERLVRTGEQTSDPLKQADYFLAAANLVLAQELEPACTRRFLHLPGDDTVPNELVRGAVGRAEGYLARAARALETAASTNAAAQGLSDARQRVAALDAFFRAVSAYVGLTESDDAVQKAREASSRLSVLLEHPNTQIASAATFWQAVLRMSAEDSARVLSSLELALADPPRNSLPFSFHARLLRCRALALRGSHASALALLTQMEDRCIEWMASDRDASDAVRTIAVFQVEVLQSWRAQLSDDSQRAHRAWCEKRIDELLTTRFAETHRLYRIKPAVPVVAAAP